MRSIIRTALHHTRDCLTWLCLIALAISILGHPPTVIADDEQRGRLADGRAYRVDAEGNQLVDYLAELELSVQTYERRVQGLEQESRDKQAIIDRLQRGATPNQALREKTISGRGTVEPNLACDQKVKKLTQLVEERELDLDVQKTQASQAMQNLQLSVDSLKNELSVKSMEVAALTQRLAAVETTSADTSMVAVPVRVDAQPHRESVAISSAPKESIVEVPQRAPISEKQSRAVIALRGRMLTDINSLGSLLRTRDAMYLRYQSLAGSQGIQIESSNDLKRELDTLRQRLESATQVHQLSPIRGEISAVRGRVQREVALMRRVVR